MKMLPVYIDIEASGLGNTSYPIEIAWNDPTGKVTRRLIKPADGWRSWDFAAERIHGISKEEIEKDGVLVGDLCNLIREDLRGVRVYSDAPKLEKFWLDRLFQAGEKNDSPLLVLGVSSIPEIKQICYEKGLYTSFKEAAINELKVTHRADADVKIHMSIFKQAREYCDRK